MNVKNILSIIAITLSSTMGCFAEEIKIENPYENVGIQWNKQYKSKASSINKKEFFVGNKLGTSDQADKIDIQVILNKGKHNEIKFPVKSFDAHSKKRSEGQEYVEISSGNNEAKISYSIKVQYGTRGKGKHPIIKSIAVKIISLSIEGEENSKTSNNDGYEMCVSYNGKTHCTNSRQPICKTNNQKDCFDIKKIFN